MITITNLKEMNKTEFAMFIATSKVKDLKGILKLEGIKGISKLKKIDVLNKIMELVSYEENINEIQDINPEGVSTVTNQIENEEGQVDEYGNTPDVYRFQEDLKWVEWLVEDNKGQAPWVGGIPNCYIDNLFKEIKQKRLDLEEIQIEIDNINEHCNEEKEGTDYLLCNLTFQKLIEVGEAHGYIEKDKCLLCGEETGNNKRHICNGCYTIQLQKAKLKRINNYYNNPKIRNKYKVKKNSELYKNFIDNWCENKELRTGWKIK